jgi:ribosome-associated translation inhibitor RaiA
MQLPLQITFRHMDSSDAVAARIHERSEELERFFDRIVSCRVVVECQHPRRQQGNLFRVRVDLISAKNRNQTSADDLNVGSGR